MPCSSTVSTDQVMIAATGPRSTSSCSTRRRTTSLADDAVDRGAVGAHDQRAHVVLGQQRDQLADTRLRTDRDDVVAGLVPQQVADPHRCTSMCSALSRRYCRVQVAVQIDAPAGRSSIRRRLVSRNSCLCRETSRHQHDFTAWAVNLSAVPTARAPSPEPAAASRGRPRRRASPGTRGRPRAGARWRPALPPNGPSVPSSDVNRPPASRTITSSAAMSYLEVGLGRQVTAPSASSM